MRADSYAVKTDTSDCRQMFSSASRVLCARTSRYYSPVHDLVMAAEIKTLPVCVQCFPEKKVDDCEMHKTNECDRTKVMCSFSWALWTWHMMWKWVPSLRKLYFLKEKYIMEHLNPLHHHHHRRLPPLPGGRSGLQLRLCFSHSPGHGHTVNSIYLCLSATFFPRPHKESPHSLWTNSSKFVIQSRRTKFYLLFMVFMSFSKALPLFLLVWTRFTYWKEHSQCL